MRKRINLPKERKRSNTRNVRKYILLVVVGVLAISSIFMTVETATSGVEVSHLRQKEQQLYMEKRNLEGTLMQSLSVNDLEIKGSEMGFIRPVTMVYVSESQETMAKLP